MNFDLLTCGVCYEKFDHNDRVPRVLPMCGHTICSICLKNILTNMGAKCPFDQKSFSYLKFEGCPVNFLVKQMIEGKVKTVFCQAHKQETRFVCFTDKRNICDECVWRDGHQSHKIKTLNAIKDDTIAPRDELESLLEEVDKCFKGAKDALEEQRSVYLSTIRNRFEEIKSLLDKKEFALNAQVNQFIDTQVKRIETKIGTSSTLRESMSKRLVNLKDIFQHEELLTDENFLEEMQSYINEYKHKIDFKTASEEISLLRKSHQEKSHLFNKSILSQHKFWKDLEFPLHDVLEDFIKIFPCEQTEEFKFEPPHFDFSKSFSSLMLKDGGTSLEIFSENLDVLETNSEDLDSTASELLVSRYSPILNCIQKRISQTSTISLKINPLTIHKENSLDSTAESSFFLSTIEMNVGSYSQNNDKTKAEEVTKMHISKLNRIDKIMLTLDKAWLQSNFTNQNFVKDILQTNCLTGLSINLQEMLISHERLSDIFSLMPDLRTLSLNFEGSNFDDIAIQFLNEITLQFAVSLHSFDASFFKTHVTDIGFSSFTLNSKTLSAFFLDIGYTKISNKTIEYLSKALEDSFETLESFTLSLGHNKITDEGLDKFFTSMPQVKSFSLGLFRTAITDATIETFVQKALPSMEQLENLILWLQRTQVTDKCVRLLISNVKPLKKFSLNLSATKVTNESIEPLVKEFLPAMKSLRELSLKFDDTEVSQELRDAAKKLEEDIVKSTLSWK